MTEKLAKIRRVLFERTVSKDDVKQYIDAHHYGFTQTVQDCFKISDDFGDIAKTLEVYMKPDPNGHNFTTAPAMDALLNHITVNLRNCNYWHWIALYIAIIEANFGVSMFENRDAIVVGNYPQELQDLTGHMYKLHMEVADGRMLPPQTDSHYSLQKL